MMIGLSLSLTGLGGRLSLNALTPVATTFSDKDEEGAVITALTGWAEGSSLQFIPDSGGDANKIVVIDDAEADFPICVGSVAPSLGTIAGVIRETNPAARNSPRDTPITLTCKAFDYYVDPDSGSPANNGLTQGTAFLALANVPTGTPNIFVGVKPAINRETYATSVAGMYIRPWTKGSRAAMWGSVSHTSGWTQVGLTFEWKKTLGYTALNVFELNAIGVGATVTKLIKGTVTSLSAGQFGANATEVFIYSLLDPNGRFFEIPKSDASAIGLSAPANKVRWAQMDAWFCPANGLDAAGNDVTHYGMSSSYNSNDGSGGQGAATGYREYNFVFRRNGQARSTSGSAGDGGSRHLTSTGLRYVGTIIDNEKEGIGDQRRTSVKNSRLYLENNNNEYVLLDEGGATAAGHHRLTNSIVVMTSTDAAGSSGINCLQNASSGFPSPRFEILNVVVYLKGGTGRTGISVRNGIVTVKNVIIEGAWNRGVDFRSTDAGSMVNTNLCVHGATTAYFNNGTPGVVAGPNSITTDPKFVDPTNGDFRLQASSPCFATGIDVNLASDYAGVAWATIPNMGAYQTAV